jgi:hypothetical protein
MVDLTRTPLESGDADPEIENSRGVPAYWSYGGSYDGLKLVLNSINIDDSINGSRTNGWTVLHEQMRCVVLVDQFLEDRLRFWVDRGANFNTKVMEPGLYGWPQGTTPLHVFGKEWWRFRYNFARCGVLELFLENNAELHAIDGENYTIMRQISEHKRWKEESIIKWFDVLAQLGVDIKEYLDIECSIYKDSEFDPLDE